MVVRKARDRYFTGMSNQNNSPLTPKELEEQLKQMRGRTGPPPEEDDRLARPIGYTRKHGGLPPTKKSLGQNWLEDPGVCREIAHAATSAGTPHVLEVGPGGGALTEALLDAAADVVAVELDQRMVEVLAQRWGDNDRLRVVHEDVIQADWPPLMNHQPFVLAGNLPYHITSILLFNALDLAREQPGLLKRIVVLVQLEVARRIVAQPGDSEYGILSVFTRFWGEPELILEVGREAFNPPPKVDAGVLVLDIAEQPRYEFDDWQTLKRLVKGTFGKRRKMLRNSMPAVAGLRPWQEVDFDWTRRPQTLSAEEYAWLARELTPKQTRG